jgi:hypothetical protein
VYVKNSKNWPALAIGYLSMQASILGSDKNLEGINWHSLYLLPVKKEKTTFAINIFLNIL